MNPKFVKIGRSIINAELIKHIHVDLEQGSITVEFIKDDEPSITVTFNIPSVCEGVFDRAVKTLCN